MAKYNPSNNKHQAWLAQNILNTLKKWGFEIDEECSKTSWEFVCSRKDKFDASKRIIVYTSIDKSSGAMRDNGMDRIRVVVKKDDDKTGFAHRVGRINRVGEFKAITNRLCENIIKAQKVK